MVLPDAVEGGEMTYFKEIYHRCSRCGEAIFEGDRYDKDDYGDYICSNCLRRDEREAELEIAREQTHIINLPESALDYRFAVARDEDGSLWFWGAYDDRDKANNIAEEVDGVVVEVDT